MRRVHPRLRLHRALLSDEGVSHVVAFAVAILVYGMAFAAFLAWSQSPGLVHDPAMDLGSAARSSAIELLDTDGNTTLGTSWLSDPDHMSRFGLSVKGQPGLLDLDKLRILTKGSLTADATNGLLDYPEAKAALGSGTQDFHLRTFPLLPRMQSSPTPITGVRVAYVGDWSMQQLNGSQSYLVKYTTSLVDVGSSVYLNVTITNNGTTDSVFQTTFSLPLQHTVVDTANTGMLAAGTGSEAVSLHLYKGPTWWVGAGLDRNVTVNIKDGTKSVANFKVDLGALTMTAGTSPYALAVVSPEKLTYKTSQQPKIDFDVFDGSGAQKTGVPIRSNFTTAAGVLLASDAENTKGGSSNKWDAPKESTGEYLMTVNTTGDYGFSSGDRIYVTDGSSGTFTPGPVFSYVESAASVAERRMLVDLVAGFKNATYNSTGGDVYMDFSNVMNDDFANNLSANGQLLNYTAVVVGSNVDQNAMSSGAAMDVVRNYTLAGGLLVVLGSPSQQAGWLNRLFSASIDTSGNGLGTPDPTHPILHVPEELAYPTYVDNGYTWSLGSTDTDDFTHVIVRSAGGDALALSKPGHYGNGTVILTGWQPYALTSPQSLLEAERVLYNFLNQVRGSLYVDFGPELPTYASVQSTARIAAAPDPLAPTNRLLVRVVLYTFE